MMNFLDLFQVDLQGKDSLLVENNPKSNRNPTMVTLEKLKSKNHLLFPT